MRQILLRLVLCIAVALSAAYTHAAEQTTTAHGLSLFGSLKYPENFTHFDYTNPKAPKGGGITLAAIGSFDSLNPFILRGDAAAGTRYLYDSLLVSSGDEPSSEYGLLAASVTRPDSNEWVEFVLRPEATWHDGTPVTAKDVVFTFNALMEHGLPHYRTYYADVETVEARDERTVRFNFKHGNNRELALILGQIPILPAHYYGTEEGKQAFDEPTLTPPLGSGPYRIAEVKPGTSIVYERADDYWGKDLPVNRGHYNFDRIRYDYYRDESVVVEALKAGEFDFRQENIARIWATAYETDAIKNGTLKKEMVSHGLPAGTQGFWFNTRRDKFSDPRVRKALTLAYDFEWANKHLFHDAYTRTIGYFDNSDCAAHEPPSQAELALLEPYKEQLPEEVFSTPFSLPVTDGSGRNREQLLQARELLRDAGWTIQNKQLVHESSPDKPFTIEFLLNSKTFERVVAPYLDNLAKLGIQGNIRIVDDAQYQKRVEQFDFDMIATIYGQSLSPGNEQMNYWHSSTAQVEGSRNYAGISHPAIDQMVESLINAGSRDELITACRALDRVLSYGYYNVPHWHLGKFRIIYWDKFGQPETRPRYKLGFPDTWWWDESKATSLKTQ